MAAAAAAGQPRPIVVAAFLGLALCTQMLLAMYGLLSRWLQVRPTQPDSLAACATAFGGMTGQSAPRCHRRCSTLCSRAPEELWTHTTCAASSPPSRLRHPHLCRRCGWWWSAT